MLFKVIESDTVYKYINTCEIKMIESYSTYYFKSEDYTRFSFYIRICDGIYFCVNSHFYHKKHDVDKSVAKCINTYDKLIRKFSEFLSGEYDSHNIRISNKIMKFDFSPILIQVKEEETKPIGILDIEQTKGQIDLIKKHL